jgi:hypothetical protein
MESQERKNFPYPPEESWQPRHSATTVRRINLKFQISNLKFQILALNTITGSPMLPITAGVGGFAAPAIRHNGSPDQSQISDFRFQILALNTITGPPLLPITAGVGGHEPPCESCASLWRYGFTDIVRALARYHSTVRRSPASKSNLGSYPRRARALVISACECLISPPRGAS